MADRGRFDDTGMESKCICRAFPLDCGHDSARDRGVVGSFPAGDGSRRTSSRTADSREPNSRVTSGDSEKESN